MVTKLPGAPSAATMPRTWVSWNGNVQHPYASLCQPTNEAELIECIKRADGPVRVFGHRYSSADICAGTDTLIDITSYNQIVSIDHDVMRLTAQSGATLADVIEAAEEQGWAIPCLPDIAGVTLGGAIATGTHGTGQKGHILAEYMTRCTLILANGTRRVVTHDDPIMDAARVSLGVLGVFSEITLQCVPLYTLHLKERPMRDAQWLAQLDALHDAHDFLRILWLPHTGFGYVITGDRVPADHAVRTHPGVPWLKHRRTISRVLYTATRHVPRLTSIANKILFALFFSTPREHKGTLYGATVTKKRGSTMELAEWTIARSRFVDTFTELKAALDDPSNNAYAHVPMDIRFLQQESSWLSYAYGDPCVTVGCVCRDSEYADQYEAFDLIERVFLKHGGRPHWAKRFKARAAQMSTLYPKWQEFRALRAKLDPRGMFLNDTLREMLDVPE